MKIAFTGTSCTGKSTTAKTMQQLGILALFGLEPLNPANTRAGINCPISSLPSEKRLQLQQCKFNEKFELENNRDNFLTERSFVDILAYRFAFHPCPGEAEISSHISLARKYCHHFYFPSGLIQYVEDGTRPNLKEAEQVSQRILKLLNVYNIQHTVVCMSSLESRCELIKHKLQEVALRGASNV
jgi:hypothetical protein